MMTQPTFKDNARDALKMVIDPELNINIVDLGLIYDVTLDTDLGLCTVTMTLTIMGCPLTDYLNEAIESTLMQLPEVDQVLINLVWEPAWSVNSMSREAKLELGLH
ncbi:aromatic ring hydroxylating protein [Limosilactobacillus fermentum]|nr:aromatic ring hydroxylating protein [Limosilactobacillus fermentum]